MLAHLNQKWCWEFILRTYECFFAEFLEDLSLVHLSLLDSPTCVGFRYGYVFIFLDAFLGNLLRRIYRYCYRHFHAIWILPIKKLGADLPTPILKA